jgi:anti-sigma regulatory factor (Ser/Thr protein kinase)
MTNGPSAPPAGFATALPSVERIALAAVQLPARPGTDDSWYDAVPLDGGRVALVVAGVDQPGGTSPLRATLAALRPGMPLARALTQLDRAIEAAWWTGGCGVLDGTAGVLHWSRDGAGPAPLLVGPDGVRRLSSWTEAPRRTRSRHGTDRVEPGETVVVFQHGAPAAGTADLIADRVVATAARCHGLAPEALAPELLRAVDDRADVVLLVARVLPAPIDERLPAVPRWLTTVRHRVGGWSAQAGLPDDAASDLQLMLSEAVSNAIEHAYRDRTPGEFVYAVRRRDDAGIRVEVQDFGRWRPPPADPGYRGRGLAVIHTLAREVTLDVTDVGTRLGFTVPPDPPPLGGRPSTERAPQWWTQDADGGVGDVEEDPEAT